MPTLLDRIAGPADLKQLSPEELPALCGELRHEIVETCARNGGHLGSSLGAVELGVALHYVFETPRDRLVWDVGHQAYAHKILTGRRERSTASARRAGWPASPNGRSRRTTPSAWGTPPPPSARPWACWSRSGSPARRGRWWRWWATAP